MAKPTTAAAIPDQSSDQSGRRPLDKFHEGSVHVSIWKNEGPKGAFLTASFEVRYRDKEQNWQTSHSYGAADLRHMENAAKEARTRIETWQQQNKGAPANEPRF
jgi:hypothetical protein